MRNSKGSNLFVTPEGFFHEVVHDALSETKTKAKPLTQQYLVELLQHHVVAENVAQEMLAELYLKAGSSPVSARVELYKRLGDTSLYISGFFGDSLSRKIIDIDYYAEMGGAAYGQLSSHIKEDSFKEVYGELSRRFLDFVEVLTWISQKTLGPQGENVLRLYDRFLLTGSSTAREGLIKQGVIPAASARPLKKANQ